MTNQEALTIVMEQVQISENKGDIEIAEALQLAWDALCDAVHANDGD